MTTAGHPEYGHAPGIETTTGPLGQGLANAVGMALAERHLRARFGADLVDHWTYVIASDGDLMEGISHEACSLAGHQRLERLIVLYDDNQISIDGPTSLALSDDVEQRFSAYGWRVEAVDGHDPEAVAAALATARTAEQPSLIACRTVIAHGAPNKAGTAGAHGAPLGAAEIAGHPRASRLAPSAVRDPGSDRRRLAGDRPPRPGRPRGLAGASRGGRAGAPRRLRAGALAARCPRRSTPPWSSTSAGWSRSSRSGRPARPARRRSTRSPR